MAKPLVAVFTAQYYADIAMLRNQGHDLGELVKAMDFLVNRKPLPKKYHDHQLSGIWRKSRDLHIEPDWLLIYTYIGRNKIRLECTGTHHHVLREVPAALGMMKGKSTSPASSGGS